MIGSLSQLIRGLAILAIEDGSEQITRDLLKAIPVDYAAERGATARPAADQPARPAPGRAVAPGQQPARRTAWRRWPGPGGHGPAG